MKKNVEIIGSMTFLILGVLALGADRLFVSADTESITKSMSVLTTVSIALILIGTIWLFSTTFKKKE